MPIPKRFFDCELYFAVVYREFWDVSDGMVGLLEEGGRASRRITCP